MLETALELLDREGLGELSMRKLATELDVETMSLYRHVANKDDLLAGIADLIWDEIAAAAPPGGWDGWLRSFGRAVRDTVQRHPNAVPVLVTGEVGPPASLELFADQLERRELDPVERARAVTALRTVAAFALGAAVTELSCFGSAPDDRDESERRRLLRISRALPTDTPERLVDTALTVCDCDGGRVFDEGLEVIVRGCDLDS